jgi:uncharacterized protein with PQ loop repeat
MTLHSLALSLAYTGAALGVVMVVPQIVRTLRHPTLGGVSPVAWGMTVLGCSMWLTYGLRTATLPQVPGNVFLVSGATCVVLLVPSPVTRGRRALYLAGAGGILLAVALVIPPHSVGYLAVTIGLVSAWPQVYDSVVTWRLGARSGVSVSTWSLKAVSQLFWLAYAVLDRDVPVLLSASVALSTAVLLVTLETLAPLRGAEHGRPLATAGRAVS